MIEQSIVTDYLIVGAGAVGMAFADQLLTESEASIAIVDRQHRPGGHWNDAYPFVRLHQPSAAYGVNSKSLGSDRIDKEGLNAGYSELASGPEIVSYFDGLMRERFLASGRVRYLPMHDYAGGVITSRITGERVRAKCAKTVDATLTNTEIPAARPPPYDVAAGMICRPPNDLPKVARVGTRYVIIGAGKTAIDTCCWLLEYGVDPAQIAWIVSRDPWLMDRSLLQVSRHAIAATLGMNAAQMEAVVAASSVEDLFFRLEKAGVWGRVDQAVAPRAFRCAIVSRRELDQLRLIKNVVRFGRVKQMLEDRIVLEEGVIPTNKDVVHVDCTACGIARTPVKAVFSGDVINIQMVRTCQPTFSAALTAHIEVAYADDAVKNRLCAPIPMPEDPIDWLKMTSADLANRQRLSKEPGMNEWMAMSRLDGMRAHINDLGSGDVEAIANLKRYGRTVGAAASKLGELLASVGAGD